MDSVNLDCFASSQVYSKIWLASKLELCLDEHLHLSKPGYRIYLLAGWYGVLNFILRTRNNVPIQQVRSFDIDPSCESIANAINNLWYWQQWQFKAETIDINQLDYRENPDVVINSSVEHMSDRLWFDNIPKNTFVCLQASDLDHDEHCSPIKDLNQLADTYRLSSVVWEGSKRFEYDDLGFNRYMIMGFK